MAPRTDLSQYSGKAARERGDLLLCTALLWTLRWEFVSDQTLADLLYLEHDTERPRYGYDLTRRGWLKRHEIPAGVRLIDGRFVYSLSPEGRHWLEKRIPESEGMLDAHPHKRLKPAWSQLQHLLDLQRIALRLDAAEELDGFTWMTEPEIRTDFVANETVPDLMIDRVNYDGLWIEYDRTAKDDLRLAYMVQRYADIFLRHDGPGRFNDPQWTTDRLVVIVGSAFQQRRYTAFFSSNEATRLYRNPHTRKIHRLDETYSAAELIGDQVVVWVLDDVLNNPEDLEWPPEPDD